MPSRARTRLLCYRSVRSESCRAWTSGLSSRTPRMCSVTGGGTSARPGKYPSRWQDFSSTTSASRCSGVRVCSPRPGDLPSRRRERLVQLPHRHRPLEPRVRRPLDRCHEATTWPATPARPPSPVQTLASPAGPTPAYCRFPAYSGRIRTTADPPVTNPQQPNRYKIRGAWSRSFRTLVGVISRPGGSLTPMVEWLPAGRDRCPWLT